MVHVEELEAKSSEELAELATELGISGPPITKKDELIYRLLRSYAENDNALSTGVLEIMEDGYGFLRRHNLRQSVNDVYISQSQIRRFGLRTGDLVTGYIRPPKNGEKFHGLLRVEQVNGEDPNAVRDRPAFENLTAISPNKLLDLETTSSNLTTRLIDMISPIGRGQRGLIVSPPKAGKTTILKQIANALTTKHPDVYIMVALIGERPEEVTDMKRSVKGEVVHSTFDEPVEEHTRTAEMALERAKRLVEMGKDVVLLLDSLTRLTRAYNLVAPSSGRTLSGGMDPVALYPPKRFFGAARNCEEGGSLTILASCLVDTGSRMDDVIYEEFKGTGNMELHLDRKLFEKRIFPAIDIARSSTRREELLLDEEQLKQVWLLRRMLTMIQEKSSMDSSEAAERVLDRLSKTKNNKEFLANLSKDM